jgi:glycosyltransferase involved in cell wall biosynthesis
MSPRRIDLHVHTCASNEASEAVLNAIDCPECFSSPTDVYEQATRRGMDFVAVTDHDTIEGALSLAGRSNVLIGEELSCWFPEDGCKMHVLVWGITREDHDALQARAQDIYQVAAYLEQKRLAHAVAHPLYRQNDKLERWHLERLILLFKGFECLNGAHSALHREAFDPMLNNLTRQSLQDLADRHLIVPRWPEPWFKARTGGSDDHGLLNIGRTWTEFPPETRTIDDVLNCLREGTCQPGGEAGSGVKLAHNFLGVGVRYYTRKVIPAHHRPNFATVLMQTLVGDRKMPARAGLAKMYLGRRLRGLRQRVLAPFAGRKAESGSGAILREAFLNSMRQHLPREQDLGRALRDGLPPLGEHEAMFRFVAALNRETAGSIADAIQAAVRDGRFSGLFDGISAILAQQFVLLPYYFAFFHQNRERHLLRRLTGHGIDRKSHELKVGLFTDTLDDINGVARFIRDMGEQARKRGLHFVIHTCTNRTRFDLPNRKNFEPMLSRRLPFYPELEMNLPPVPEILEWADRQQFDAIHVSTPGAMGLCGWLVARMLNVPLLGTYHTDFPAYVDRLSGDHRLTAATTVYMRWFYRCMTTVFSRSREYQQSLVRLGVDERRLTMTLPGINTEKFNVRHRDLGVFETHGVREPRKLLYCGRVSREKNLQVLVDAFKQLCIARRDTALLVAGDGPFLAEMREQLAGLPAYFLGYQNDQQLGPLYASCDLFVFPSRTDTLGQVVMEAQSSGLPVIVSDEGGPKEICDDGITGTVVRSDDPSRWCQAIEDLLDDEPLRLRMSRTAPGRINRFSLDKTFEAFWQEHADAVLGQSDREEPQMAILPSPAPVSV